MVPNKIDYYRLLDKNYTRLEIQALIDLIEGRLNTEAIRSIHKDAKPIKSDFQCSKAILNSLLKENKIPYEFIKSQLKIFVSLQLAERRKSVDFNSSFYDFAASKWEMLSEKNSMRQT